MRSRSLAALVALGLAASAPGPALVAPTSAVAKSCRGSYVHAVINGAHKCLRRGQYCARRADRQYHRYGFHCHKRDRNGDYHLT
ncbi:MAG TPA: hypothetical protein VF529_21475 [Solirubrobacteraceae bacterium]|jgi:hypothetical protein